MEEKTHNFIKKEILTQERRVFVGSILVTAFAYFGISLFLNSIRATAPIMIVWLLIIIQFVFYFLIFIISYKRSKILGLKTFALPLFTLLAVLGRVNDWEIVVIPAMIIIMVIFSSRSTNISEKMSGIIK